MRMGMQATTAQGLTLHRFNANEWEAALNCHTEIARLFVARAKPLLFDRLTVLPLKELTQGVVTEYFCKSREDGGAGLGTDGPAHPVPPTPPTPQPSIARVPCLHRSLGTAVGGS